MCIVFCLNKVLYELYLHKDKLLKYDPNFKINGDREIKIWK